MRVEEIMSGRPIFRVLIVDDNPPTANYVAGLLHLFGFHALPVYSLREALENLDYFDFSLALIGIVQPERHSSRFPQCIGELIPGCKFVQVDLQHTLGGMERDGTEFDYFSLLFRAEELLNLVRDFTE
jgi:CheY-like chemotaxis protein